MTPANKPGMKPDSVVCHVVFDWNGTLIDDLALAVQAVNQVCARFGVAPVSRAKYRDHFRFPIADFYAALGFDFARTPFADIVQEYLSVFDRSVEHCPLHAGSLEFLDLMQAQGISLSILSASHQQTLRQTIAAKGLSRHFTHIHGLADGHAAGKLAQAHLLQEKLGLAPQQILYVGDTLHDVEIANAMGWPMRMLSCGHQSERQLEEAGVAHLGGFDALLQEWRDGLPSALPSGMAHGLPLAGAPISPSSTPQDLS